MDDLAKKELGLIVELAKQLAFDLEVAEALGNTRATSQGEKLKGGGISDPTGSIVTGDYFQQVRDATNQSVRQIRKARVVLDDAVKTLGPVFAEGEITDVVGGSKIREAELEDLKAAQARRVERGEGIV